VKGSGASPAEAGLFPASTSEETADKEGTGTHGHRREGLGDSEGRGRHLLPPSPASRLAFASWCPSGFAFVQRPPSATTRADAGKRARRNTARHETDTRAPASKPAARCGSAGS
jgi:hypothetical protein